MPSPARTHHRRRSSGTSGKHKEESDVRLLDVCDIPRSTLIDWANLKDSTTRRKEIKKLEMTQYTSEDVTRIEPMSFIEEASCMFLFLFGVPGAVFSLPVLFVILYYLLPTKIVIAVAAIPLYLAVSPVKFNERSLISWQAVQISKYFSFKVAFDYVFPADQPFILVAPPHGVFPFGNIITMLAFPSIMGFPFHGLAASAAFSTPVYRQLLTTIGVIDASRRSAEDTLSRGKIIGISTGGVAEVFETNADDEVILLRERRGLVRLALRTGAPLVPCYLFGNTKLLSVWCGELPLTSALYNLLKSVSRSIGFALIIFWGRLSLPVPYRVPIFGVLGKPIPVEKKTDFTDEEVEELLAQLVDEMIKLFDQHKASYGWAHKKLIVR